MILSCLNGAAKKLLDGEGDLLFDGYDPDFAPPFISLCRHILSDGTTKLHESVQERVIENDRLIVFLCLTDEEGQIVQGTTWDEQARDNMVAAIGHCGVIE